MWELCFLTDVLLVSTTLCYFQKMLRVDALHAKNATAYMYMYTCTLPGQKSCLQELSGWKKQTIYWRCMSDVVRTVPAPSRRPTRTVFKYGYVVWLAAFP